MSAFDDLTAGVFSEQETERIEKTALFERDYKASVKVLRQVTDLLLANTDTVTSVITALEAVTDEISDAFGENDETE